MNLNVYPPFAVAVEIMVAYGSSCLLPGNITHVTSKLSHSQSSLITSVRAYFTK